MKKKIQSKIEKIRAKIAVYMAFVAAVFVCVMAAATVASHDVPLMLGGL